MRRRERDALGSWAERYQKQKSSVDDAAETTILDNQMMGSRKKKLHKRRRGLRGLRGLRGELLWALPVTIYNNIHTYASPATDTFTSAHHTAQYLRMVFTTLLFRSPVNVLV